MKIISALVIVLLSSFAIAEEQAEFAKDHPCKDIKAACEAAGFKKGMHKEGKGLWMDCMSKIKKGEAVPGVSVSAEKIAACKAKLEHAKASK